MTREEIYDTQIQPLMDQIAKLCDKHSIPMMAALHIGTPDRPGLMAKTLAGECGDHNEPPAIMLLAALLLNYGPEVLLAIKAVRVKIEDAIREGSIEEMTDPSWDGEKKKTTLH
jgi:hypothetical protein